MWRRGLKWDVIGFMTIVYYLARTGKNDLETNTLRQLLGQEPIRMKQFVQDYLSRWEHRQWT